MATKFSTLPHVPYAQKLRDPRWQKKRLEVFQRDHWQCQQCQSTEKTLQVHHFDYERAQEPWDSPLEMLVTLCESCHKRETQQMRDYEKLLRRALRRARCGSHDLLMLASAFAEWESWDIPSSLRQGYILTLAALIADKDRVERLAQTYEEDIQQPDDAGPHVAFNRLLTRIERCKQRLE